MFSQLLWWNAIGNDNAFYATIQQLQCEDIKLETFKKKKTETLCNTIMYNTIMYKNYMSFCKFIGQLCTRIKRMEANVHTNILLVVS
jgi:hypothetical protein